jgi:exodeoxyribonuclease V beta subunit
VASRRTGLAGRLLTSVGGERTLTDLRHLAQLLHEEATAEQLGVSALAAWLHSRMEEDDDEVALEDRTRRLESDAEAVQVLTVFRSKGLEFPIVYCPYLWNQGYLDTNDPPVFHDPRGVRTIDVSGDRDAPTIRLRREEARGEELRLAYVALTRAKHQAVVWWAATGNSAQSSLCRMLFCREADGSVPAVGKSPADDRAVERLTEIAAAAAGSIAVERVGRPVGTAWTGAGAGRDEERGELQASTFDRSLDPTWRRTSYSALTAAAHDGAPTTSVGSEADDDAVVDEEAVTVVAEDGAGDESRLRDVVLPLSVMRAGAEVGTFVHGVFERCDFSVDDVDGALVAAFAAEALRGAVELGDEQAVRTGLRAALETPLGPLVGDLRLRDLGPRDRVDELTFELPLAGGDSPTGALTVAAIGDLLLDHLPAADPMREYGRHLQDPLLETAFRGYLTGSIDLVLRTPDGRYAVIDYKTNRLAPAGEMLTAWHYRPTAVREAMFAAHYPLQALLYTVALHRYLRWRQPGYAPESHLAGILYLFVRGMAGADTPVVDGDRCGVFSWRPPAALVEALSDLFDTGIEVAA